jgi:DNA-binding NarL/FixJ family response regulator
MIKILIADDHQIVIDGLKALLMDQKDFEIIGEVNNGQELIEACERLKPDLVLSDIGMPIMDGIAASRSLKAKDSTIKILVLTTYTVKKNIREMLKIGVDGYVLKDSGKDIFIEAIQTIIKGETYYDKRVTDIMMSGYSGKKTIPKGATPLTNREKEIIVLIVDGMSTSEIGAALFLSDLTIETHRKNIYTKLGINKIANLVRYALEEGLVN